jgi:hypothetical protein
MTQNSWPGQQHYDPYPMVNHPPTANLPYSSHHSGYVPQAEPPLYGGTAYYTDYRPAAPPPTRPSAHWPLVVVAVVLSGVLLGGVAVYHAVQVGRRWTAGDVRGAVKASGLAKTWALAGIVVGAVLSAAALAVISVAGPTALGSIGTTSSQVPLEDAPPPPITAPGTIDPTLERPAGLDSIETVFFDQLQSDLQLAADRLDRGEDPTFQCVSVLVSADTYESSFAGAATKAREQCGREIPLAWAAHQLDSAAALGDPIDAIVECATAKVSLDFVEDRFADPRVGELRTRSDQVCR